MLVGVGIHAVILMNHAEVAGDVDGLSARRRAVRACVHEDGSFFCEHGVGVGSRKRMGHDLAAADGDEAVLIGLQTDADDVHIEVAVEREFRRFVVAVAR